MAHPGDGADAVERLRPLRGLGVSGGKVLKAPAGAGIIHTPGALRGERLGFYSPTTESGRATRHNNSWALTALWLTGLRTEAACIEDLTGLLIAPGT